MIADTLVATAESVVSIICRPTLPRDRPSRLRVLREEPGGPAGMEHTLSAAAQETHATLLAPKATFTQVLSIQKHMAHFPMLHVGLEASFILALQDKHFGAAAKRIHVPNLAVPTVISNPQS